MISTREAADMLGVSVRRVQALVKSGDLAATKLGRTILVDEEDVRRRMLEPRLRGRPKMGQKNVLSLGSYTLMCRNHEVFDFTYDNLRKTARVDALKEVAYSPLGTGRNGKPNNYDLAIWISRRYMPALRPEARSAMAAAKVASPDELMFAAMGLNLSDQYWFRPAGIRADWHDVNFFENDFEPLDESPLRAPDSSTPGALPKRWECRGRERWLMKGSSTGEQREPYNEALATRLAGRILAAGEYVPYRLEERGGRVVSACKTMATERTEFVSANEVAVWAGATEGRDLYAAYAQACERLGVEGVRTLLSKMIVFDYIMANFDRHRGNFGLVRDSESLGDWRVAPLFDNGSGFFSRATASELGKRTFTYQANPFEDYPLVQVARAEDLSWFDPQMLEGFPDEVREALSANRLLPEGFAEAAARHVERHIAIVEDFAAERIELFAGF